MEEHTPSGPALRADWSTQKIVQDASLLGRGWPFGRSGFFLEKRRVTAPADLALPKRVGVRVVGLGLGSAWSGPTCKKVELGLTRPEQRFAPTSPAHSQSYFRSSVTLLISIPTLLVRGVGYRLILETTYLVRIVVVE